MGIYDEETLYGTSRFVAERRSPSPRPSYSHQSYYYGSSSSYTYPVYTPPQKTAEEEAQERQAEANRLEQENAAKEKAAAEALAKRKTETPLKLKNILELYNTNSLVPHLKTLELDYEASTTELSLSCKFSDDLALCKREKLLAPDEIASLESIEAIIKIFDARTQKRVTPTHGFISSKSLTVTIDKSITSKAFSCVLECLSLPDLHDTPLSEVQFVSSTLEDKESIEPLAILLQRAEKISFVKCTINEAFVKVLEHAKSKAGMDFNVKSIGLTETDVQPGLLQRVLNLVPSPTVHLELSDAGYSLGTPAENFSKLRIARTVGDISNLLKMLPAGKPKQLELGDIAFTRDLVFQDDALTELVLDKNSLFLSSFVESGSFVRSLKGLPKLQTLKIKSPTFHNKEARIACLRAITNAKDLQLQNLDLSNCGFEEQELEELIPYLKNNQHLVSLNLTGNNVSLAFLTKLENVILETNWCLAEVTTSTTLTQKLKTALTRNASKELHLKNFQKAESILKLADESLQLDEKEVLPHESFKKKHEEFLQGYRAMQGCVAAFYPTPDNAVKLQERYFGAVVTVFTKWLQIATTLSKPDEILFCHHEAFNLLKTTFDNAKQAEILVQYLQKNSQQLIDLYNFKDQQKNIYNHFDYILKLGVRIENDALIYHGCLALTAIANKITDEKECHLFISLQLLKFITKLRSASAKKVYEKLLETLCTKKSLLLSERTVSLAKDLNINIAPCYLSYLRNLSDLILAPEISLPTVFKQLQKIQSILFDIEPMQFAGKEEVINMAHAIINSFAAHHFQCNPFTLPEKPKPETSTLEAKLLDLVKHSLSSSVKKLHEDAKKNITEIYRKQIFSALAASGKQTHFDQLFEEKHTPSKCRRLAANTRDAADPLMLQLALDTYIDAVFGIRNRELKLTLMGIRSELQPIIDHLLKMKTISFTYCELPNLNSKVDFASTHKLVGKSLTPTAPTLEVKAIVDPVNESKAYTRIKDLYAEIKKPDISLADMPEKFKDKFFSHNIMFDPVIAADGFTYERTDIQKWINQGNNGPVISPATGEPFIHHELSPNMDRRSEIIDYLTAKIAAQKSISQSTAVVVAVGSSQSPVFAVGSLASTVASAPSAPLSTVSATVPTEVVLTDFPPVPTRPLENPAKTPTARYIYDM